VYGEPGRYPMELQIKIKMLCFWNKIVGNPHKLSGKIYRLLSKLIISGNREPNTSKLDTLMHQIISILNTVKPALVTTSIKQ
jgi:hypothetical protein